MQNLSKFIYISLLSMTSLALACTSDDGVGDTATATESSTSEGSTSSTGSTSEATTDATTGTGTMGSSTSSSSSATETTGDPTTTTTTGDTTTTTTTTGDTTTTTTGDTTTTGGGGVCDPAPGDDACASCSKENCCSELEACDGNEGCTCWFECLGGGGDFQECFLMCGQSPEFQAFGGCAMGSCGNECGF